MEFKDLFVKQRPPKDYVSYPPQETPTLEKFFQERTNKPVTQEINTISSAPKAPILDATKLDPSSPSYTGSKKDIEIPEQEVEQIKQIYSTETSVPQFSQVLPDNAIQTPEMPKIPTPSYQEQISQTMGRVPAKSSLDLQAISEEADRLTRKTSWEDALPALAPLAVEAIFGPSRQGETFKLAGDYLVGEVGKEKARKQKLEDTLLSMERARQLALAKSKYGKESKVEVDVEGKPIITPLSEAWGKQAWKAPQKPSGISNEDWMARQKFLSDLKLKLDKEKLTDKQKENIIEREMKLSTEWNKDEFTRGTRKVVDSFKRIASIDPYKADPVQDMGLIFDLMRSLDPQSVVRESEQAMAIGARSYEDVANYFDSLLSGKRKLTPDQVLNIKKFASRLYQKRLESQKLFDQGYLSKAGKYSLDPSMIVQSLSAGVPVMWKNSKTGRVDVIVLPEERVNQGLPEGAIRLK